MTTTAAIADHLGLLDKERIIAPADYNRWLVPPAALAIHLCIGMAYGFSVFWKPLQGALLGADGKAVPECSAAATSARRRRARCRRSSPRVATGASSISAGCTPCSSCCSVALPPSGVAGSSGLGHAEPAWSPPFAGAVAF